MISVDSVIAGLRISPVLQQHS